MKLLIVSSIVFLLLLTGCATTKTIEIPVPVPCVKPKNIPVPHDYMADLNKHATPPDFVRACLATREDYKNAYEACMMHHHAE